MRRILQFKSNNAHGFLKWNRRLLPPPSTSSLLTCSLLNTPHARYVDAFMYINLCGPSLPLSRPAGTARWGPCSCSPSAPDQCAPVRPVCALPCAGNRTNRRGQGWLRCHFPTTNSTFPATRQGHSWLLARAQCPRAGAARTHAGGAGRGARRGVWSACYVPGARRVVASARVASARGALGAQIASRHSLLLPVQTAMIHSLTHTRTCSRLHLVAFSADGPSSTAYYDCRKARRD